MDNLKDLLNNKYFVGLITVPTVLYASLARPALPQHIAALFEHPLFKIIIYALIVLLLTHNLQVALVVSIAFYVLMSMLREQRVAEGFIDGLRTEAFYSQNMQSSQSGQSGQSSQNGEQSGQSGDQCGAPVAALMATTNMDGNLAGPVTSA